MPKYLFQASYTRRGVKGLLKEGGSKRAKVVDGLISSAGGTLEAYYFAFGDNDVYCIAEFPDEAAAAAVSLAVAAGKRRPHSQDHGVARPRNHGRRGEQDRQLHERRERRKASAPRSRQNSPVIR